MYYVYWLRTKEHTEPFTQGYIGITNNPKERLRSHKKNKRKTILTSAATKHGWDNIDMEVLHGSLSREDALNLERMYRPELTIGWNCQAGGNLGVEPEWYDNEENASKHRLATSVATKAAIAEKDTHKARSDRAKESWKKTREKRVEAVTGSNNPRAILTEDEVWYIKYICIPGGFTDREIAEMYEVRKHVISFIRSGKNWKHV